MLGDVIFFAKKSSNKLKYLQKKLFYSFKITCRMNMKAVSILKSLWPMSCGDTASAFASAQAEDLRRKVHGIIDKVYSGRSGRAWSCYQII